MMLGWMLYVLLVSLILGLAALLGERAARLRRRSTRWLWITAMITCLCLPAVMSSVSVELPSLTPTAAPRPVALRQMTDADLAPGHWAAQIQHTPLSSIPDQTLRQAWCTLSGLMALILCTSAGLLRRRERHWEKADLAGISVSIAEDIGPAVVGLWRPHIVLPRWLLSASASDQRLAIAHEQAHLDAHDATLLTIALILLVIMPWNLPLWWQLRRLRCAIEVDCDARVLARGIDRTLYGELLISVGARQSSRLPVVAAMAESDSFLARRLHEMIKQPSRFARSTGALLSGLALFLAVGAAEVSPPNSPSDKASPITLAPATLDHYVGIYQFGPNATYSITRKDGQLLAQLSGQPAAPIFPASETEFFYRAVKAQITFQRDGSGIATGLILHQNGGDFPMPRIDSAKAAAIATATGEKIRNQTATPGTEAALRHLIEGFAIGKPDYAAMAPGAATSIKEQIPELTAWLSGLGDIKSLQFIGVNQRGMDRYTVRHQNGASHWVIALNDQGLIAAALVIPGP